MGEAAPGTFQCDSCGRRYPWKAQLAGRTARCRCGTVVRVPQRPPEPEQDLYDLAPEEPAQQAAQSAAPPGPVTPVTAVGPVEAGGRSAGSVAGQAVPPARTLAYARPDAVAERDDYIADRQKDFQIPLALLVGGIVVQVLIAWWEGSRTSVGIVETLAAVGIDLVFGTIILLIGAFIAARARGIYFGPFWIAVLKLSAIAIAPGALAMVLDLFLRHLPFLGWILTWVATFMFYFALIGALFDLDQSDTWYMVMVVFVLRVAVVIGFLVLALAVL